ncbi:MAG: hypothetical protein GF408_06480 [Candidatus Omnitrophica bacterium]|nr:hypothetical protein [Candidatus Omnitrophota bacterium]
MHEIKFAENIVKTLEPVVKDPGIGNVKKICLEVGKMHYIVPEILETGFKGTPRSRKLRRAELEIKVLPLKVRCRNCSTEREVEEMDFTCGSCGKSDTEITSGKEFTISKIEYSDR